jgi:hypothetical protein
MLRKLHEAQAFGRILDASLDRRYQAALGAHLPGAVWIGTEAWLPGLDQLRLRRRRGRLGCTDIRIAAAATLSGLDLALFEGGFEQLEPDDADALARAWLARAPLVLVVLPAAAAVGAALPGLCTTLVQAGTAVRFLSTVAVRRRQLLQLQGVIPGIVQRLQPGAVLNASIAGEP